MSKLIIVYTKANQGSPVDQRIRALKKYLSNSGYDVVTHYAPNCFSEWVKLGVKLFKEKRTKLIISMPAFRGWYVLFFPGIKVILDWRDGWSAAILDGYGKQYKPNMSKYYLTKCIELVGITLSTGVIVCTHGLLNYHQKNLPAVLRKKITLIPNGSVLKKMHVNNNADITLKKTITAICVGKFAEYGSDKCHQVVSTLLKRYPDKLMRLELVGCDVEINEQFSREVESPTFEVSIYPRLHEQPLMERLLNADLGIVVLRSEELEYGTKSFDYVVSGLPILDTFSKTSEFKKYFSGCFDTDFDEELWREKSESFKRHNQLKNYATRLKRMLENKL